MTATQAPTPGPLDSESVKLLVKGDLCLTPDGAKVFDHSTHWDNIFVLWFADHEPFEPDTCTFIGRPGVDGWMPWSGGENPVPGQRVNFDDGTVSLVNCLSDIFDVWEKPGRFRLAPTAPVEASGSEREAAGPGGWLIRESDGGWLWTGTRIAAVAALTEGHEVVAFRPQPSGETREAAARLVKDAIEHRVYAKDGRVVGIDLAVDDIAQSLSARPLALGGQQGQATWHPLDDEGLAEVRVNGKRITSMPSYDGAKDVAQRINEALSTTPARAEAQDEGAAIKCLREIVKEANAHKANSTEYGAGMEDGLNAAALLAEEALRVVQSSPSADLMTRAVSWMKARKLHEIDGKDLIAEMDAAHPSPTPAADADRVRIAVEALEPFVPVWAKLTGLSDGIDVRLDASFALQDATGRARGATCNPNLPKLTVGDFRKAHKALAALKSTAAKEGGEG